MCFDPFQNYLDRAVYDILSCLLSKKFFAFWVDEFFDGDNVLCIKKSRLFYIDIEGAVPETRFETRLVSDSFLLLVSFQRSNLPLLCSISVGGVFMW